VGAPTEQHRSAKHLCRHCNSPGWTWGAWTPSAAQDCSGGEPAQGYAPSAAGIMGCVRGSLAVWRQQRGDQQPTSTAPPSTPSDKHTRLRTSRTPGCACMILRITSGLFIIWMRRTGVRGAREEPWLPHVAPTTHPPTHQTSTNTHTHALTACMTGLLAIWLIDSRPPRPPMAPRPAGWPAAAGGLDPPALVAAADVVAPPAEDLRRVGHSKIEGFRSCEHRSKPWAQAFMQLPCSDRGTSSSCRTPLCAHPCALPRTRCRTWSSEMPGCGRSAVMGRMLREIPSAGERGSSSRATTAERQQRWVRRINRLLQLSTHHSSPGSSRPWGFAHATQGAAQRLGCCRTRKAPPSTPAQSSPGPCPGLSLRPPQWAWRWASP